MKHSKNDDAENVVFNSMPEKTGINADEEFITKWDRIHETRDIVKKAIEVAVKAKEIRSSLEAKITLKCTGEMYDFLKSVESELTAAYIVSEIEIVNDESATELKVEVSHAAGEKSVAGASATQLVRILSTSHFVSVVQKFLNNRI